ncbi:uncharacterized protein B0H18DRAFT_1220755, partial [Fomitopsis serialis]|uniref:uncharacterized protein n=1 Tax=Fomitopsis serialis TaxID=139415 RepID=UPI002007B332
MTNEINLLNLGSFFIEIFCCLPTNVFTKTFKNRVGSIDELDLNPVSILEINEKYVDELSMLITGPMSLPMICEPNKWSDDEFGGYLSNSLI